MAQKSSGSSKSRDFVQGSILNPWNGHILWFSKGLFHNFPPHLQHRNIGISPVLLFLRPYICVLYLHIYISENHGGGVGWGSEVWGYCESLQGEEIVKSTLFCKVCYVLYTDIKPMAPPISGMLSYSSKLPLCIFLSLWIIYTPERSMRLLRW